MRDVWSEICLLMSSWCLSWAITWAGGSDLPETRRYVAALRDAATTLKEP